MCLGQFPGWATTRRQPRSDSQSQKNGRNAVPGTAVGASRAIFALLLITLLSGAAAAKKPGEALSATEKGQLKNPHAGDKQAVDAGHKLFMSAGCNGCHGGTGGGGMGRR